MKIVLTCGHPHAGYRLAHEVLVEAGLTPALPSQRESMSPAELHEKIRKAHGLDVAKGDTLAQVSPGKVWQNLAIDLFMGNLAEVNWGWADANTVWLLDFWKDFDPQIRFVLAYSALESTVGQMLLEQSWGPGEAGRAAASWSRYNTEILGFYNRNPERCLLVNLAEVAHAPARFAEKAATAFGLDLNAPALGQAGTSAITPSLAKALVEDCAGAAALYLGLESSADLDAATAPEIEKYHAWQEYTALLDSLEQASREAAERGEQALRLQAQRDTLEQTLGTELAQAQAAKAEGQAEIARLQTRCAELASENEQLPLLRQAHEEALAQRDTLEQTLGAELAQAQAAKAEGQAEIARLQTRCAELASENEQLPLLRQVQEELENCFIKLQQREGAELALRKAKEQIAEQEAALNRRQTQLEETAKARDEQTRLAAERQAQLEQTTKAHDQQAKLAAERQTLLEQAAAARDGQAKLAAERQALLDQAAAARDGQAKLAAERQAQWEQATKAHDEQAKLAAEHQRQAEALAAELAQAQSAQSAGQAEIARLQAKDAELAQENEFLLLQLHQAQEELERYFLQYEELAAQERQAPVAQISEAVFDLRGEFVGENWYHAEPDGRWAGPEAVSSIKLPPLRGGRYEAQFDIVDAMDLEILAGMEIFLDETPLAADSDLSGGYPVLVRARFDIEQATDSPARSIRLKFPRLVSPAESGSDDERRLAVRLRTLKLSPVA